MRKRIIGKHEEKATIFIEFFENGHSLLYLEGTKPFIQNGLTLEKAQSVLTEAEYSITVEDVEEN